MKKKELKLTIKSMRKQINELYSDIDNVLNGDWITKMKYSSILLMRKEEERLIFGDIPERKSNVKIKPKTPYREPYNFVFIFKDKGFTRIIYAVRLYDLKKELKSKKVKVSCFPHICGLYMDIRCDDAFSSLASILGLKNMVSYFKDANQIEHASIDFYCDAFIVVVKPCEYPRDLNILEKHLR